MSGIAGIFDTQKPNEQHISQMLSKIKHRGSENAKTSNNNHASLGIRYPEKKSEKQTSKLIQSDDAASVLVCDGNIYNDSELQKHTGPTHIPGTLSNDEVLIPLYQQKGTDFIKLLNGVFSFIMNTPNGFLVARDPIGVKPLYYGTKGDAVYFASEMKALLDYVDHISEFPNGSYCDGKDSFTSFYEFPQVDEYITDVDKAVALIREKAKKCVSKRLTNGIPIGVFLSGGLDSSIIAAIMKESVNPLHSFTVGFKGAGDLEAARQVARHLGTIHHEFEITPDDALQALPEIIYYLESYDAALVRSSIGGYFASKLAADYVPVICNGEGSDELFCGYSFLADETNPDTLLRESKALLNSLHNVGLQRGDRTTAAHGIEGRVPLLDIEFINAILTIHPSLKAPKKFDAEKGIFRKAFESDLPENIVWRIKQEFAQGSAISANMGKRVEELVDDNEFAEAKKHNLPVSCKEEYYYYKIFTDHFKHPEAAGLVGKWKGPLQ